MILLFLSNTHLKNLGQMLQIKGKMLYIGRVIHNILWGFRLTTINSLGTLAGAGYSYSSRGPQRARFLRVVGWEPGVPNARGFLRVVG